MLFSAWCVGVCGIGRYPMVYGWFFFLVNIMILDSANHPLPCFLNICDQDSESLLKKDGI